LPAEEIAGVRRQPGTGSATQVPARDRAAAALLEAAIGDRGWEAITVEDRVAVEVKGHVGGADHEGGAARANVCS
jgi:hypothetical protein